MKKYHISNIEKMFQHKGRSCKVCGAPANQAAHCIPQRKAEFGKYGWQIIHHWTNLEPACSLKCNAELQFKQHEWKYKFHEILKLILSEETND